VFGTLSVPRPINKEDEMGRLSSDLKVRVRAEGDDGWRFDNDGRPYRVPKVVVNSDSPCQRDQRRKMLEDGEKYQLAVQRLLRNSLG
jgi:hypothetical protein